MKKRLVVFFIATSFWGALFIFRLNSGSRSLSLTDTPQVQASRQVDSPTYVSPSETNLPTLPPSPTLTSVPEPKTKKIFITPVASPAPKVDWIWYPAGKVVAPILLYHHVADVDHPSRYYQSLSSFEGQMKSLKAWGYTSISISSLVKALKEGAELPVHPVIITFDDGYLDIYHNALPMMRRYGFTGVVFIITNQVGIKGYLRKDQLREMLAAGWEIGSHSYTHSNLRWSGANLEKEIEGSRSFLEEALQTTVNIFSFPYGLTSKYITKMVGEAGYQSAVGLGGLYTHTGKTIFYLSRIEVSRNISLSDFTRLLPWPVIPEEEEDFVSYGNLSP